MVFRMLYVLIFALCCTINVVYSNLEFAPLSYKRILREGTACDLSPKEKGECVSSLRCQLPNHEQVKRICEWKGSTPVVCCPKKDQFKEFIPLGFKKILKEGSSCMLTEQERGKCIPSGSCHLPIHQQISRICEWQGSSPIVCCSEKKEITVTGNAAITFPESETNKRTNIYNDIFNGPDCTTKDRTKASCVEFFECKNYPELGKFNVCGWQGYTPKICCRKSDEINYPIRQPPIIKSYLEEGSACAISPRLRGTCELIINCKTYPDKGAINVCGWAKTIPLICCPALVLDKDIAFGVTKISATVDRDEVSECGLFRETLFDYLYILNGRNPKYHYRAYILNETADAMSSLGYSVKITRMQVDAIDELQVQKGNRKFIYGKKLVAGRGPMGGHPAGTDHAQYMASLGVVLPDGKIHWICDGVVINFEWIMSAAHCFEGNSGLPTLVRLGVLEHDEPIYDHNHDYHNVEDFGIAERVLYPKFVNPQRYHDIVLIRLSRPIPKLNHHMNPLCLPWKSQGQLLSAGKDVVLTGWGATRYLGSKTNVLQEVNLTVFDTAVCDASYATLEDYNTKWPEGMDSDHILCAGAVEGGKDACSGDSGAPLIYLDERGRFTLAGIVSGGHGCGLKEFPGLYIPITGSDYLEWIRKIAF